ncbi:MAG: tRNA uridine-5-carboxymethylaminomethyl(34) synthesis GTPase MnmE [Bacilli bacterium]
MNLFTDTIVALATPPTKSALAIIRMSGPNTFTIFSSIFSKNLTQEKERSVHLGTIQDKEELIDQAIVVQYIEPKSFTGENLLEIMIHGSPLIAHQVIELLIAKGARPANPGEFSSRAYLNQKLDLVQAEAIHDVIQATTVEAKRLSLLSLTGKTSEKLNPIRQQIADILALMEVNIDYPEYQDIEQVGKEKIIHDCAAIIEQLNTLIVEGEKGRLIKEGIKVAIIGKPNVGKSSLLNALINEEKAIVTDIAGTTRDVVEAELNLQGVVLKILDTAGIRETENVVEAIGVRKAIETVKQADVVIYVKDATKPEGFDDQELLTILQDKALIEVFNKSDLLAKLDPKKLYITAKNKEIQPLLDAMIQTLGIQEANYYTPSFNNTRQLAALKQIREHLQKAVEDAKADLTVDLLSSSLQLAYQEVIRLLGLEGKMDLGGEIFSRFCVGK